jgi:hypothetical protein
MLYVEQWVCVLQTILSAHMTGAMLPFVHANRGLTDIEWIRFRSRKAIGPAASRMRAAQNAGKSPYSRIPYTFSIKADGEKGFGRKALEWMIPTRADS